MAKMHTYRWVSHGKECFAQFQHKTGLLAIFLSICRQSIFVNNTKVGKFYTFGAGNKNFEVLVGAYNLQFQLKLSWWNGGIVGSPRLLVNGAQVGEAAPGVPLPNVPVYD